MKGNFSKTSYKIMDTLESQESMKSPKEESKINNPNEDA